jgi:hypothetical protein
LRQPLASGTLTLIECEVRRNRQGRRMCRAPA